ncbi:radical SAM peptide maturase [Bacteroides faecichinchillae]|uniref:Radical SAM core domain-containing protein n=1 Tax=Bacteroides faecichinchillae TaxID=871325 RepID=A0A1M4ZB54_9BACE|nr:radical SAM peptide maturase [Bacteroides faecichinchillae]THG68320.1 radical SAM peptide maturase [Bacteroides faecichinchillae]SHF15244.1 uncharacterized protein SAMN05444349_11247 [Bacteroides faecichinchillae]
MKVSADNIRYNLNHLFQLVFEVTDMCNLRCKYCGYADLYEGYDERENLKFPFQRAKLIIDYLYSLWSKNQCENIVQPILVGFYGGEPLLNVPFIQEVIAYIESLKPVGKVFRYNMTTNAMLLDRYMDFLVEKKFNLLISLDGNKEGQGYRVDVAGHDSFDRVYSNVCLLRERYPEYFKEYVMFNSVLHNKNSVESIYSFIKGTFRKEPIISPLNGSGIRKDKLENFFQTYRNYSESIQEASNCEAFKNELFIRNPETRQLLDYIYQRSENVFISYNELLFPINQSSEITSGTCTPFSKKMFVTVKGKILQCERINHEFALGQVTDSGVELDLEKAAQQHNDYVSRYARQCKSCGHRKACVQCVYQIDDIHEATSLCRSYCSDGQIKQADARSLVYLDQHPELYRRILKEVSVRG